MQERNWIMGLWKFSDKITIERLGEVAQQWADDDPHYLQLYIRRASKDQRAIGFTYEIFDGTDPRDAQDAYFEKTSDFLKRQFGNDLAGWDIAATIHLVK